MRTRSRGQKRARKRPPVAPARMPGLNFDTFESESERKEGVYGTDRAPTYQARYAASSPRRYVRKILDWFGGARPRRAKAQRRRRARPARSRPLPGSAVGRRRRKRQQRKALH